MSKRILEVEHLNSYYRLQTNPFCGKADKKQVLFDVSFHIDEGEVLGLVGESGCGKTTLSRTILGMVADYDGKILHHSDRPQMVFQDPFSSLNPAHTIGWILEEPLRAQGGLSKAQRRQAVKVMLEQIGLNEEYYNRRPRELSGGQRQRVSIASAVITHPKLIIADEPVSALDVTIQAQILDLLADMKKRYELSYLFISHDLNVIYQISNRVMVMRKGHIVEEGTADDIFYHPKTEYTRDFLAVDI